MPYGLRQREDLPKLNGKANTHTQKKSQEILEVKKQQKKALNVKEQPTTQSYPSECHISTGIGSFNLSSEGAPTE